jgi:type VI secretion system protein ImpK
MNYPNPPVPQRLPSLSPGPFPDAAIDGATAQPRNLLELMADGFYLLMLLKRGQLPGSEAAFVASVQHFLDGVERGAIKLAIPSEDVYAARYAFCAAVDEAMLGQPSGLREAWECNPLQLRLFGEHLAGEHFFDRLEQLRAQGAPRLPSLEVYHYCLLLGFEGRYRLEGPEKLGYLIARLGDEIVYLKGRRTGFAPHWAPPDRITHALRRVMPLWAPAAVLAMVGAGAYFSLHALLERDTRQQLATYHEVVQLPAKTAHLTITLP